MKNLLTLSLLFFFTTGVFSQDLNCVEDFENQTPTPLMNTAGNWETNLASIAFELDAAGNNTIVLHGKDASGGGSAMTNLTDYSGNWLGSECEICFDIRYVAGSNNPATGVNAIYLFQNPGNAPTNVNPTASGTIWSRFEVVNPIGPDWVQVCAPISLSSSGNLPSNNFGQWAGSLNSTQWDNLIQDVSGISFRLDFAGGANPAEDVYVDNICVQSCPPPCAIILEEDLTCIGNDHSYTFTLQNNTGLTVDGIIVNDVFDPSVLLAPNDTYGPITIPIPAGSGSSFCYDIVMFSENLQCCHYEHCIDLPNCYPCDSISIAYNALPTTDGTCCFEIDLTNNFDDQYFTKINSTILTPGVNFENAAGGSGWTVNNSSGNTLTWTPTTPFMDLGLASSALNFCLTDVLQTSQTPQSVKFDWITIGPNGQDSIACSDTLVFECETCLNVVNDDISCLPNAGYQYCITVENNDPTNVATEVYFDVYEPLGLQFSPTSVPVNLPPLGSASVCVDIPNTYPAGTEVKYKTILKNFSGDTLNWCCIVDTFVVEIPDCTISSGCPSVSNLVFDCSTDNNGDGIIDLTLNYTTSGSGAITFFSSCGSFNPTTVPINSTGTGSTEFTNLLACNTIDVVALSSNNNIVCDEDFFELDAPECLTAANCSCDNLDEDVDEGFKDDFACPVGTYTPNSLYDCDQVTWFVNSQLAGYSTGNAPMNYTYPGPGSYAVCMLIDRYDATADQNCTAVDCRIIEISDWCSDISIALGDLDFFPNPVTDILNIKSPSTALQGFYNVEILNSQGKKEMDLRLNPGDDQIDVHNLSSGIYFINVLDENKIKQTFRFVKI